MHLLQTCISSVRVILCTVSFENQCKKIRRQLEIGMWGKPDQLSGFDRDQWERGSGRRGWSGRPPLRMGGGVLGTPLHNFDFFQSSH